MEEEDLPVLEGPADLPAEAVEATTDGELESHLLLTGAFDVLDETERRIVYLRFVREVSRREAAAELGMTADQLRRRTRAALAKLRAELEDSAFPERRAREPRRSRRAGAPRPRRRRRRTRTAAPPPCPAAQGGRAGWTNPGPHAAADARRAGPGRGARGREPESAHHQRARLGVARRAPRWRGGAPLASGSDRHEHRRARLVCVAAVILLVVAWQQGWELTGPLRADYLPLRPSGRTNRAQMFRAQCSRWLLFGALVPALARMHMRPGRPEQHPEPAPPASAPRFTTTVVSSVRQTADRVAVRRLWVALLVAAACACVPATAAAAPSIVVECNGTSTCEGPDVWFRTPVFVDWTVSWRMPTAGCQDITLDRDTAGNAQGCSATGGGTSSVTVTIKLTGRLRSSWTPPRRGRPTMPAGYTHPVEFMAHGTDATSGIASCVAAGYGGPDSFNAIFGATCRDVAGNGTASRTFALSYDDAAGPFLGDHQPRWAGPRRAGELARGRARTKRSSARPACRGAAPRGASCHRRTGGTGFIDREVRERAGVPARWPGALRPSRQRRSPPLTSSPRPRAATCSRRTGAASGSSPRRS